MLDLPRDPWDISHPTIRQNMREAWECSEVSDTRTTVLDLIKCIDDKDAEGGALKGAVDAIAPIVSTLRAAARWARGPAVRVNYVAPAWLD